MKFFKFEKHDLRKGIPLVLLAWLCFTGLWTISKLIEDQTTIPTMLFFRNLLGLVVIIPWIIKYWPKSLKVNNQKLVITRSILGLLNLLFIFLAVQQIFLVNTTLLNNTAPFFVPFLLLFWKKIPIDHKIWPAILIGFIGVILILQPNRELFNWGSIYGLLSGLCLALVIITMRLTTHSETLYTFLLYFFVIGIIATTPFALLNWKIETPLTLISLLSMGLLSAMGQIFLFFGLRYGKAHELAPLSYSTVIFSGIFEWILWGHTPKLIAFFGMALILAAGIWIVIKGRLPKKLD